MDACIASILRISLRCCSICASRVSSVSWLFSMAEPPSRSAYTLQLGLSTRLSHFGLQALFCRYSSCSAFDIDLRSTSSSSPVAGLRFEEPPSSVRPLKSPVFVPAGRASLTSRCEKGWRSRILVMGRIGDCVVRRRLDQSRRLTKDPISLGPQFWRRKVPAYSHSAAFHSSAHSSF